MQKSKKVLSANRRKSKNIAKIKRIIPEESQIICLTYSLDTNIPSEFIPEEYIKEMPIIDNTRTEKKRKKSKFVKFRRFILGDP